MKKILIVIIAVFAIMAGFAGWKIYQELHEYSEGEQAYEDLTQFVDITEKESDNSSSSPESSALSPEPDDVLPQIDIAWPEVDFAALQEINPDIVGWLYIEDTVINYPIVQGDDNSYYLNHLFEGNWNGSGCIFLDSRNESDFSDRNSVIYGHHMQNGSMFAALDGYKKQEFYEEHPVVMILTPEANYLVELFSGYVANVEDDAWELGFTAAGYADWLSATKERSCFSSPIEPTAADCVVTLSTCSYEFSNARFVVVGVANRYTR